MASNFEQVGGVAAAEPSDRPPRQFYNREKDELFTPHYRMPGMTNEQRVAFDAYTEAMYEPQYITREMLGLDFAGATCQRCADVTYYKEYLDGPLIHCTCNPHSLDRRGAEQRLDASGIPPKYRKSTFTDGGDFDFSWVLKMRQYNPGIEDAYKAAQKMAKGTNTFRTLVLAGDSGWGKTALACRVLNARIAAKRPGIFILGYEMMRELREATMESPAAMSAAVKKYQTARFLVIDDMWAERTKEFVTAEYFAVMNFRLNDPELQTIVTTNMELRRMDDRIADRLMADRDGTASVHELSGIPSYRSGVKRGA
jgi:DNA replication protein DnaC